MNSKIGKITEKSDYYYKIGELVVFRTKLPIYYIEYFLKYSTGHNFLDFGANKCPWNPKVVLSGMFL